MDKFNKLSSVEFSNLYLMTETKIITLMWYSIYIFKKYLKQIVNAKKKRKLKEGNISTLYSNK